MEFNLSFAQIGHVFSGASRSLVAIFPLVILVILSEIVILQTRGSRYPWKSSMLSASIAFGHLIAQALTNGIIIGVVAAAAYHWRLTTIPITKYNWPALIALFILADLAFYIEHRCSHRVRFMWASHSVHHSVDRMVFTAAFRLAWTPILSGIFLFYLPVVWIGFPPEWVFGMASASLTYQIFVHTEIVPRIGWLESIINTPSAHRVHHASNEQYLDRNFGGVLLIWDHLFGTYQAERPDITTRYGLTHPRKSAVNPFIVAYQEFWDMFRDTWTSRRLEYLVKAPGWKP